MSRRIRARAAATVCGVLLLGCALVALGAKSRAQDVKGGQAKNPDPVPAVYDDYQNMLDQLGIKKMRRGRDGRGKDTSDEATANPHKETMPDLMTFKDGKKVKTADEWPKRRAEIVEDLEREVDGRMPRNVHKGKCGEVG